jgi:hypothetical protein
MVSPDLGGGWGGAQSSKGRMVGSGKPGARDWDSFSKMIQISNQGLLVPGCGEQ